MLVNVCWLVPAVPFLYRFVPIVPDDDERHAVHETVYVPVLATVNVTLVAPYELAVREAVPRYACMFMDEPPEYVPVTERMRSASAESPTVTVTPDLMFAAVRLEVVTPLMV